MNRTELVDYLDSYLRIAEIKDYGPQGLQIEGRVEVNKIVGLVDAGLPCLEAALEHEADLMLVHHGVFWGPAKKLSGGFGALIRRFIETNLNLYAAHLPLDAHPEIGNNAELARRLDVTIESWWGKVNGVNLAVYGTTQQPITLETFVEQYQKNVGPVDLVQTHGPTIVQRVGILSGGGANYIEEAAAMGCDTYLTGETSQAQYYDALRAGVNVIYGGHYMSETVGVQALGQHLADTFGIAFEFVDLPTGM
ncbi:MAG: Nif3-like dinuclear metal center hexameric protein [Chloroflexota bacterium]